MKMIILDIGVAEDEDLILELIEAFQERGSVSLFDSSYWIRSYDVSTFVEETPAWFKFILEPHRDPSYGTWSYLTRRD